MKNTIESILAEFDDKFRWHENKSYTFVNPKGKQELKAFLLQALKTIQEETREETLKELKDNYEQVQQDLDEEYQDNKYCPNYMGILEERLEVAKLKTTKDISSDEVKK